MPDIIEIPKILFRGRRIWLESQGIYWGKDDQMAAKYFREFCCDDPELLKKEMPDWFWRLQDARGA